jgi:hypothetical protein
LYFYMDFIENLGYEKAIIYNFFKKTYLFKSQIKKLS